MTFKTRVLSQGDCRSTAPTPAQEHLPSDRAVRERIAAGKAIDTPFGGYRLIKTIGSGGMGQIYEAEHQALKKRVAMKFLLGSITSNPEAVVRFQRESQSIGQLDHPNILRATDAGCIDGLHYLVTDLLCGQDLTKWVLENGPMPLDQACDAIRQAALGLAAAHAKGYVHRDIKPSNLFLQTDGTIKLLDFGLVREAALGDSETQAGAFLGTVDFLSPEQASHPDKASPQSDIYSLGCTWIYLLSGQCPYPDSKYPSLIAKLRGHMMDQPEWLQQNDRRFPKPIAQLIKQMIAKQSCDRPKLDQNFLKTLESCTQADRVALARTSGISKKKELADETPHWRVEADRPTYLSHLEDTVRMELLDLHARRGSRSKGRLTRLMAATLACLALPAIILLLMGLGNFSISFGPMDMNSMGTPYHVIESSVSGPFLMTGPFPPPEFMQGTGVYPMTSTMPVPLGIPEPEPKRPSVHTVNNRPIQSAPIRTPGSKTLINRFAQPPNEPAFPVTP